MDRITSILSGNSHSDESQKKRKRVPWMSGPLDPDHHKNKEEIHSLSLTASSIKATDPVFKTHKEASPIELFYDLFFVANLATFTINHEIFDSESLQSYVGFFSLMWFTWFQIALFDVRFASDSVFHRISKAFQLAGMAGFALVGSAYDTSDLGTNAKAFRGIAIILMSNRLTLFFQYGTVLFYVKSYPRTWTPLLIIMATMFVASMVYLATYFGFYGDAETYIVWYVFACVEIVILIFTSSRWRVLSFTRTHLVERVGLLTLIIMGEGVLGLAKSTAFILKNTKYVSAREAGVMVAAVFLIYFIWILYFDQIEHERFGTVRMQIWAILHYPVHLFILGTVEGQTNLLLWNIVAPLTEQWLNLYKYIPGPGLETTAEVVEFVNSTLEIYLGQFKSESIIKDYYNYTEDLVALSEIAYPAGSQQWIQSSNSTIGKIWAGVISGLYESFEVGAPEFGEDSTQMERINAYTDTFVVVFTYFYIASGLFLISLAILYLFGKGRLRPAEWAAFGVRLVAGIGLSLAIVPLYYPSDALTNTLFIWSPWHIIIVMLVYFIVIVLDNFLVFQTNKGLPDQDAEHGSISGATLQTDKPDKTSPHSSERT